MNATQPSKPPVRPVKSRQVATHKKKQHRLSKSPYWLVAVETTVKLTVNVVLSALAVSNLMHLLPYSWSQQEKWQEISTEVKHSEGRVNNLRTVFSRYFDPQQAETIMKEQSSRLEPGQRQIFWQDKSAKDAKKVTNGE